MTAKLNAFGLVVADMGRSLAFYRQLGLDIPAAADAEPHVEHELAPGVKIMWDTIPTVKAFDPQFELPADLRGTGLAFQCDSPAEVDRVHDEMVKAGHHSEKAPWDAFWGQRYAVLRDPDGRGVDLYAAM